MKINTTVSIDQEILDAAKAEAKRNRRSFSSLLENWMAEALDWPAKPEEPKTEEGEESAQ
jgi:hypothetical protein